LKSRSGLTLLRQTQSLSRPRNQGGYLLLHVDLPTRSEILAIASARSEASVTIYLATSPLTEAAQADRIALKNLGREAVAQLEAAGTDKRSIWPIEAALEEIGGDDEFWAHQANSLAIFITPDSLRTFRLPSRLTSAVHVSDRFHIKPLLRAVTFGQDAYVLAIGRGAVRLIEVSGDLPPHAVPVPGLPRDMGDAIGRRSHTPRDRPGNSGEATSENALLTRYARAVDEALRPVLSGHERPLIIAAAEPMLSIYRSVSSYAHTAPSGLGGSADHTADHVLASEARAVLDQLHAGQIAELGALFAEREGQGRATTDVAQAARAATFGAIDTLIVDIDVTLPGSVDDETGAVTFSDVDDAVTYGVVDEIVSRAMKSGARIVSARKADVPGNGALAAILRYPM
jgi:Bacterial archaeo-eukaryotic release factor family 11